MTAIQGGVTAPKGYRASGVAAGIKPSSTKKDCALIVSDSMASVAGLFTTNVVKAPGVRRNATICEMGQAQAVFVNSGNANTCTGDRGIRDVVSTAELVGASLGIEADAILACSTGVIGVHLPMDRIAKGVDGCVAALSTEGSSDAAMAIMTTDTVSKERAIEIALDEQTVRIGGIAKGSGMIAPNMATMIALLTTDAAIGSDALATMLRRAVEVSFNRICVDNDMSTSDTVLMLANGAAGGSPIDLGSEDFALFETALTALCQDLARDLVRDGEGATKFVTIEVTGAASDEEAKTVARSIAHSQLCKTAFSGEDPNWGRLACAAGYSGIGFDPEQLSISLDDVAVMRDGQAGPYREEDAAAIMKKPEFTIHIALNGGSGTATFWTTDLSHDYVSINADYRS